jgi:hypothetical protein
MSKAKPTEKNPSQSFTLAAQSQNFFAWSGKAAEHNILTPSSMVNLAYTWNSQGKIHASA